MRAGGGNYDPAGPSKPSTVPAGRAYEMAQREAATKTGPQRNVAKAAVARIAKEMSAFDRVLSRHSGRLAGCDIETR